VRERQLRMRADLGFEFMLNLLRLTGGFDPNLFGERTGMPISAIDRALDAAERKGLLYRDHKSIRPTEMGQRFLNDLQEMFLGG
jgi:coproporphyrinogen III oxidase-like Fe-S oxidoreductase